EDGSEFSRSHRSEAKKAVLSCSQPFEEHGVEPVVEEHAYEIESHVGGYSLLEILSVITLRCRLSQPPVRLPSHNSQ
ncbi:DNA-directed RNA polymerase subunit beta', partial [Dissostichus eleginoides]